MNGTPEAPSFAMQLGGTALALASSCWLLAWFALRGLKALQQRAAGGAAADAPASRCCAAPRWVRANASGRCATATASTCWA